MKILKIQNFSRPLKVKASRLRSKYREIKDVVKFIYNDCTRPETYTILGGKQYRDRDLPNCVTKDYETYGNSWGRAIFSPKDEAKMKNMNVEECIRYKQELLEKKKYTIKWY